MPLQNISCYSQIAYNINEIESGSALLPFMCRTSIVSKSVLEFMTGSRIVVSVKETGRLFVPSDDPETRLFPPFPIYKSMRAYVRTRPDSLVAGDISIAAGKVNWSKR